MIPALLLLSIGLALLVMGGELLVRGASRLAVALGLSPLLVGLTIVAWGTSAPEFVVSLVAAIQGRPDVAVGNVVGSNVFNVLFILGFAAAVAPMRVSRQLMHIEVPILIGVSLLVWALAADARLAFYEGTALLVVGIGYTVVALRTANSLTPANVAPAPVQYRLGGNLLFVLLGLTLLVIGSRSFVHGAVNIARWLGVSELLIGLTIVAGGTSLPELATSVIASVRGERDISVGNVIGSNLFNLLFVLGSVVAISGNGILVAPAALSFDIPVMVAVAVACLPIFFTGQTITRWEGWLFLIYGVAYWTYLLLYATEHEALPMFSRTMISFVLPLTAITVGISVSRQVRKRTR